MKRILLLACVLLCACYHETDTDWMPPVIQEDVDCCITDQQVHGAIYSALLKMRWHIKDKKDNGFIAAVQCDEDFDTNVFFENTNRDYVIAADYIIGDVFYRQCIEYQLEKVNKIIQKYIRKAVKKAAKEELRGMR